MFRRHYLFLTSWQTLLTPPRPLNSPPLRAAARQKLTIFDHVETSGCCGPQEHSPARLRVLLDVPDRGTKRGAAHYRVNTAALARRRRPESDETAAAARYARRQSPEPGGTSLSNVNPDSRFQEVTLNRSFQRVRCRLRVVFLLPQTASVSQDCRRDTTPPSAC